MRGKHLNKLATLLLVFTMTFTGSAFFSPSNAADEVKAKWNLHYDLQDLNGNTVSTANSVDVSGKASKYKVLIFGRVGCFMTAKLVESLASSTLLKDDDYEIIFIEEGKASREEMLDYVETYGLEDMTVCPTTGLYGISIMYHYLDTWGSSSSVSNFPVIFVIDKDDLIRGMTDGIIYADSIASLCSKKCDTPVTDFPEPLPVLQTAKVNALCCQTEARSMLADLNAIRSGSEGELWYWNQDDERINIDGLQPLKYNYELEKIAMQRAVEQALLCDKKRPDEKCYHTIYNEFKIAGLPCGENIAVGCENVQEVIDEWWAEDAQHHNAQEYRRNILSLDSDSEYVGIAHVQVGGKNYWVAEFASDCPDSDATAPCDSVKTFDIRYYRENVRDDDLSFPYDADYDLKWLNKLSLMVGDEYQIPDLSELINYDGSNRTGYITDMVSEWIVDDSSIAEVSGNIITAKAAGGTTITKAATFGGSPMVVTVNVIENGSSASDDNPGSGDQQTSGDNTSGNGSPGQPQDGQQGGDGKRAEQQDVSQYTDGPVASAADPAAQNGTALAKCASAAAADKAIKALKSDNDPKGARFAPLMLNSAKQTKTSITLKWKKAKAAKKYVIYGNACGNKNKFKKLKTVKGSSYRITKIADKKLEKAKSYKFILVALDEHNNVVSTSKVIHMCTKGKANYTKVTTKAKKNKVTIRKDKSFNLGAKAVGQSVKKHVGIRYETSNEKIASVTRTGKIKGKNKGTCQVYVYAQNGVYKIIKVTVK